MKTITLQLELRQVESIKDLAHPDGRRKIGQVYYVDVGNQILIPEMIHLETDIKNLLQQIENKQVYVKPLK